MGYPINKEQLKEIRDNADYYKIFAWLGLEPDRKKSRGGDLWARSPFTEEKTASFHLNERGFYCHSQKVGGGIIELVQEIKKRTGRSLNCYEVGQMLVDEGLSACRGYPKVNLNYQLKFDQSPKKPRSEKKNENIIQERQDGIGVNSPIKYDMTNLLDLSGTHPLLKNRGLTGATCHYLNFGFLPWGKLNEKNPMNDRFVFQVRGLVKSDKGFQRKILSHIGRATTEEQQQEQGKYWIYKGFRKSLELYNIDNLLLDSVARRQAQEKGFVIITEGFFDVAKLVEAKIYNAVGVFGSHLCDDQLPKLKIIAEELKINKFLVWFDRDPNEAGQKGQKKALNFLRKNGFEAVGFDWDVSFDSPARGAVSLPENYNDVCDFSVEELGFLEGRGII